MGYRGGKQSYSDYVKDMSDYVNRSTLDKYKGDDIPVKDVEPDAEPATSSQTGQTSSNPKVGGFWWNLGGQVLPRSGSPHLKRRRR